MFKTEERPLLNRLGHFNTVHFLKRKDDRQKEIYRHVILPSVSRGVCSPLPSFGFLKAALLNVFLIFVFTEWDTRTVRRNSASKPAV